jgi:hypothetical protein
MDQASARSRSHSDRWLSDSGWHCGSPVRSPGASTAGLAETRVCRAASLGRGPPGALLVRTPGEAIGGITSSSPDLLPRRSPLGSNSSASSIYPTKGGFMESVLLEIAGRRRSPATMPGYHRGRPPRNKGEQYPADPTTVGGSAG